MENKKMRILIADDNKDFCDCLSNYINMQDDMEIISIAHDGNEAVTKIRWYRCYGTALCTR